MSARFNLRPVEHLGSPRAKQALNRELFAEVAPRYDFITKALSLGRDAAWKRHLVSLLPAAPAPVCVDLACGTGNLTRLLAGRYPHGRVTGLDLTPAMLRIARERTPAPHITYVEGNMNDLPFPGASVDLVTGGYALRNAPDLARALHEIRRVLRPGGYAAFLDFSKPHRPAGQRATHAILKAWGGLWGLLLHGNADVYGYIADSLRQFPDRPALYRLFAGCGMTLCCSQLCFGGMLEIQLFQKQEA